MKVTIHGFKNASSQQQEYYRKLASWLETEFNGAVFPQRILDFGYWNKPFLRPRRWVKGFYGSSLSNEQVRDKFYKGDELWGEGVDDEMDLIIHVYEANDGVVGSMIPGRNYIKVNWRYTKDPVVAVGNLVHEFCHHIRQMPGHTHNRTALRSYSVPYGMGSIISKMYQEQHKTADQDTVSTLVQIMGFDVSGMKV